jgi:hypothetical protein
MLSFRGGDPPPIGPAARDGVEGLAGDPLVVSVSDIHGYLGAARSALKTVGDHDEFAPLVDTDGAGRLHWTGGEEYVLVFNGDLIDRGPDNERVIAMVERLSRQAPRGHVRVTLGNHEWGVLFPAVVHWSEWYSGGCTNTDRRQLCRAIVAGDVVAAYDGYNFSYAHAGQPDSDELSVLNDRFVKAAEALARAIGTTEDDAAQERVRERYPQILGTGREAGRGVGAGISWLDFRYLPADAPPQVVGHSRQEQPVQKGNVVCENVIRENQTNPGGEAVLVESPDRLVSLERTDDGGVHTNEFQMPDKRLGDP